MRKSSDCKFDLLKEHASRPYKSTGKHLLLINWRVTSSEATRPIIKNTAFSCGSASAITCKARACVYISNRTKKVKNNHAGVLLLLGCLQFSAEFGDHGGVVLLLLADLANVARPFHVLDWSRQQPRHHGITQSLHTLVCETIIITMADLQGHLTGQWLQFLKPKQSSTFSSALETSELKTLLSNQKGAKTYPR